MKKLSYSSSGVSINKGNKFVSEIKNIIRKDKNLKKSNIGGFSGQYILDPKIKMTATCVRVPVMVSHSESINIEFEIKFSE